MTLDEARRGPTATQGWWYSVEKFLEWLDRRHPECANWLLLSRQVIKEYLSTLDGKSQNTKRLALQPICQTSKPLQDFEHWGLVTA